MTGDQHAHQHRQSLTEHADAALLVPVRRRRGWRVAVSPAEVPRGAVSLPGPVDAGAGWVAAVAEGLTGLLTVTSANSSSSGLPAHRQHRTGRHRQRQPQPLHSIGIGHARRLPLPTAALEQLVSLPGPGFIWHGDSGVYQRSEELPRRRRTRHGEGGPLAVPAYQVIGVERLNRTCVRLVAGRRTPGGDRCKHGMTAAAHAIGPRRSAPHNRPSDRPGKPPSRLLSWQTL